VKVAATAMAVIALIMSGGGTSCNDRGSVGGGKPQLEVHWNLRDHTVDENIPDGPGSEGQRDKIVERVETLGSTVSVTVDRQLHGFYACLIVYHASNDLHYVVDYAHDNNPGSVTCRSDHQAIQRAMQRTGGRARDVCGPGVCGGRDTLTLNITWLEPTR
jgi:hypothetical protein